KEHINAAKFWGEPGPPDGILDAEREQLYARLLEAGLEVIDARAALIEALDEFPHVYYDGMDGHPADGAIQTVAHLVAARLWRYELERDFEESSVETVKFRIPPQFDKFPERSHREALYQATVVTTAEGTELPPPRRDGPLLVIGDSMADVPTRYGVADANVAAHLAKETGVIAKHAYLSGGAPRMIPFVGTQHPDLFKGVRVCVFVLNERYLRIHDQSSFQFTWFDQPLRNLGH
ncbi:MAG: hypothetical protein KDB80_13260, partial [Planctomycetes bacterium]|nr:hypothetical protein [Planctomycetota bacterium]